MLDDSGRTLVGDAGSGDPIETLRSIKRMRGELDRAEAAAVRRARNANAPWQLIALALEASRPALQKKYGRR